MILRFKEELINMDFLEIVYFESDPPEGMVKSEVVFMMRSGSQYRITATKEEFEEFWINIRLKKI